MCEGTVVFFVIVFFVILFVLCLLGWQNKNESDKFKAKGQIEKLACDLYYQNLISDILLKELCKSKFTTIEFMLKEIYKAKFEQDDDAILEISKRLKLLFKNTKITIEHNIVDN